MVEDWDLLIVLDACRFDAFKDAFSRYFEGELRPVRSKGSCTPEWFRRTFTGRYPDVTYVSANPYINSLGIEVAGCNAREHFDRILDLWKSSWDPHLGTVTPDSVNRAILAELERGSDRRLIAHYIQPHAPYLSPRYFVTGFQRPQLDKGIVLTGTADSPENRILVKLTKKFVRLVGRLGLGTDLALRLRDALGLPPLSPLDATRRAHGVSGLREAYRENLLVVMESVALMLSSLDGLKVAITSDHGEFLGEGGMYSHPCGRDHPLLRTVPYFEVKRVKRPAHPVYSRYPVKPKVRLAFGRGNPG